MSTSPFFQKLPLSQRVMGKLLALSESNRGVSHTRFLQDTASVWGPKAIGSRSVAELAEVTVLEFTESALVYYSVVFLGQHIFQPMMRKLSPGTLPKNILAKPLSEALKQAGKRSPQLLAAKAGMILASVGMASVAGEYVLNFAKNLFTAEVFRKGQFSDVVNLSQNSLTTPEESPTVTKAKRRIVQCLLAAGGITVTGMGLARFGHRILPKSALEAIVKRFDFTYSKGQFGLSPNQLYTYILVAVASYLDAARDSLERKEVATRLAVVLPYIAFGERLLQKPLKKLVAKKYPEVFRKGEIRKLVDIAKTRNLPQFSRLIAAKNILFFVPHAINIVGIGLGTTFLNRYWTARRYDKTRPENTIRPDLSIYENAKLTQRSFEDYIGKRY